MIKLNKREKGLVQKWLNNIAMGHQDPRNECPFTILLDDWANNCNWNADYRHMRLCGRMFRKTRKRLIERPENFCPCANYPVKYVIRRAKEWTR